MEKPFDVSIEQLAHDLALLTTANFARIGGANYDMEDYYKDYVNEYALFKSLIEKDIANPSLVIDKPDYSS